MAHKLLWGSLLSFYISPLGPGACAGCAVGIKDEIKGKGRAENRGQRLIFKKPKESDLTA